MIKTLLVGWPHLDHNYKTCTSKSSYQNNRQCFQILGFDIMLDKKLKPWLLEINESPSFNDDTEVDKEVKTGLIHDTFKLLDLKVSTKYKIKAAHENQSVVKRNKLNSMNPHEIELQAEKDEARMQKEQSKYEGYQAKNLGGFEKIYPL